MTPDQLSVNCELRIVWCDESSLQLDKTHDCRGARLCVPTDVAHAIENCY
ncbi:hypothetical protein QH73_0019655 [Scytonema millei VB511283]|uniref:Uncharacterized protein n=1 Tax=Scytonema millei VB511283 TaxID=1245923 RepID=A0A9X5I6K4_9CYAN|nr:hypothetical protein [Scytonema millei VB511283]